MKAIAVFAAMLFAVSLVATGALAAGEKQQEQGAASEQRESGQLGAQQQDQQQQQQLGQERQQQDQQQQVAGEQQQQKQQKIQAAKDLQGFKVQNAQGEDLGEISELLIDTEQGQVGYAVVSTGGVLGMGEEKYIVPFKALKKSEQQQNAFTLDVQKEQLQQAPQGDVQQALDRQMEQEIHQFYGVSPYWEESGQQQQPEQQEQMQQRDILQEQQPGQQQQEQQEQQPGQRQ